MEKWEEEALTRGYARTRKEWWFLLNHHWTKLNRLARAYLKPKDMTVLDKGMKEKDAITVYLSLQRTWDNLPDSPAIQRLPGFGILCDLCSDFPQE